MLLPVAMKRLRTGNATRSDERMMRLMYLSGDVITAAGASDLRRLLTLSRHDDGGTGAQCRQNLN